MGILFFSGVQPEDSGNYGCLAEAENVAAFEEFVVYGLYLHAIM